jgi:hypothetical protein
MGAPPSNPEPLREAFAALARSLHRLASHRNAPHQHASLVAPALPVFRGLLELRGAVSVEVQTSSLDSDGVTVYSEPQREEGLCARLHRDGVRSLTFLRGLLLEELVSLCRIALADPVAAQGPGREDAVTELWKAGLAHVEYRTADGYGMEHGDLASGGIEEAVRKVSRRAVPLLERRSGTGAFAAGADVPRQGADLLSPERLGAFDSDRWSDLGWRASLALMRIVEEGFAGRDLEALEESLWRLLDELVDRGEAAALAKTLDGLRRMGGAQAQGFRASVGRRLAEPARLARVCALAGRSEKALVSALPSWLSLLPRDASGVLLDALPSAPAQARPALARVAVERAELGLERFAVALATGAPETALALLGALSTLAPSKRAELAGPALSHPAPRVRIEAIAAVAAEPERALRELPSLLSGSETSVRVAAAQALPPGTAHGERAAALLIAAMARPAFLASKPDERALFYRALGKLGSTAGFDFLVLGLSATTGLFKRRPAEAGRMLAVAGLSEETSVRTLRALEAAADPRHGQPAAVVAAARAAVSRMRTPLARGAAR